MDCSDHVISSLRLKTSQSFPKGALCMLSRYKILSLSESYFSDLDSEDQTYLNVPEEESIESVHSLKSVN